MEHSSTGREASWKNFFPASLYGLT